MAIGKMNKSVPGWSAIAHPIIFPLILAACSAPTVGATVLASDPGTEDLGALSSALAPDCPASPSTTCIDHGTQCFGMHCCPSGSAMKGVDINNNLLLCEPITLTNGEDCFVDWATRRPNGAGGSAHACPVGTYMRGIWATSSLNDQITCCFDRGQGSYNLSTNDTVDTSHQEENMHACSGMIMTGIDEPNNRFLCRSKGTAPSAVSPLSPISPESRRSYSLVGGDRTAWKRQIRNWLMRMHDFPTSAVPGSFPAAPTRTEQTPVSVNGIVPIKRIKVSYPSAADGSTIPAYLCCRRTTPALSATIRRCSSFMVTVGTRTTPASRRTLNGDAMHALGVMAARNGFVALVPDNRGFGEFALQTHGNAIGTGSLDSQWTPPYGATLGGNVIKDDLTSLSVLAAYPRVDPNRIGVWGLSLGGWRAMRVMGLDPRVKKSVISGIWLSQACFNDPAQNDGCQTTPSFWPDGTAGVARNTSGLFETSDLATLLAPNPLMTQWGQKDDNFNSPCAITSKNETDQIYQNLNSGSSYRYITFPNMVHEVEFYSGIRWLGGFSSTGYVDTGLSCPGNPGFHCCPAGSAMAGANPAPISGCANRQPIPSTRFAPRTPCSGRTCWPVRVDRTCVGSMTRRIGSTAAMTAPSPGIRPKSSTPSSSDNATATQSFGMHVCPTFSNSQSGGQPTRTFMSGIRVDQNKQLCGPGRPPRPARIALRQRNKETRVVGTRRETGRSFRCVKAR